MSSLDNYYPSINPDDFNGTDFDKVQSAIYQAIADKKPITFTRIFNMLNQSLFIDKPYTDMDYLIFQGFGGGLSNYGGYLFLPFGTGIQGNIKFFNMIFNNSSPSTQIAAGTMGQADKFTNIIFDECRFDKIDVIVGYPSVEKATTQGYTMTNCYVSNGAVNNGERLIAGDNFKELLIENCEFHGNSYVVSTSDNSDEMSTDITIRNNIFKEQKYMCILIFNCNGLIIDGNYFEGNGTVGIGLISCVNIAGGGTSIKDSVCISNNQFVLRPAQVSNNTAAIKINGVNPSGVISTNNISNGVLYDPENETVTGKIISIGDKSATDKIFFPASKFNHFSFPARLKTESSTKLVGNQRIYDLSFTSTIDVGRYNIPVTFTPISGEGNLTNEDIVIINEMECAIPAQFNWHGHYFGSTTINLMFTIGQNQNVTFRIKVIRTLG